MKVDLRLKYRRLLYMHLPWVVSMPAEYIGGAMEQNLEMLSAR